MFPENPPSGLEIRQAGRGGRVRRFVVAPNGEAVLRADPIRIRLRVDARRERHLTYRDETGEFSRVELAWNPQGRLRIHWECRNGERGSRTLFPKRHHPLIRPRP
jgi:hypothetical protein